MKAAMHIRVILLLMVSMFIILIGQAGRELLPPDDLREVEIAREMYEGGDYIIPHLAGLPFVEKPSGFPAVVATIFKVIGGPSADAARFTAAAFALTSITAVFLLGWQIVGVEGGAFAAAILVLSQRFCRTAHEVLLDNALTAAVAFTIIFTWIALESDMPRKKRLAYAAAGFFLGVSFLFKGFVGSAIFGSGFILYIIVSRRFGELRHIFQLLPIIAFLVPFLSWTVPFLLYAPPHLIREFLITNHFWRFMSGYMSHQRPIYFYIINIWPDFAPGSILLPYAIWLAWKTRKEREGRAGIFLLSLFIGPLLVLSTSLAKDSVYLLPVHPTLALLVAWSIVKLLSSSSRGVRVLIWGTTCTAILAAGIIMCINGYLGGSALSIILAGIIFMSTSAVCILLIRRDDFRWAGFCIAILFALGWSLWFIGPITETEVAKSSIRQPMMEALSLVGNRDIVLYKTDDGIRGAASFYRNRTAQEIGSPARLVACLADDPDKHVALISWHNKDILPPELQKTGQDMGVNLQIKAHIGFGTQYLLLIEAVPKVSEEQVAFKQKES